MATIGNTGSSPPVPLKLKSHFSSSNTLIHGIPDKVWHSAKDGHIPEKQQNGSIARQTQIPLPVKSCWPMAPARHSFEHITIRHD